MISQANLTGLAFTFWKGEQLRSHRDLPLSFDVETEAIEDERQIPKLALAVASDGNHHVVIHPECVGEFLDQHSNNFFVGHNVQFDFWVVDQHLSDQNHPARRVLWDICHQGRLFDTMVLDLLLQLATGRYRASPKTAKSEGQKVYPANLAALADEFTSLQLNKEDPFRLRFGELIGLSLERLETAEPGFFRYAVADAVATYHLYPALTQTAYEIMVEYGYRTNADRYEIQPDAIDRYGYLSEVVQVKASIVLWYMFRRGVTVDQTGVHNLVEILRGRVDGLTQKLRRDFPDALAVDRNGNIQLTPKSQTPSFGEKRLTAMLSRVADEIQQQGERIHVPQNQGTKGGISYKTKEWEPYKDHHPFLVIWIEMKAIEKQLGFLNRFSSSILHGEYSLLTRTGRTACSKPCNENIPGINLQQTPKAKEFRDLFIPRNANSQLLIADYSAIELRTLATVCRARFGRSELANVIQKGIDPHAFTAAAIQSMSFESFTALKKSDPDKFRQERQAAKAINFGVPGGLGVKTLRVHAQEKYGVSLSEEEAAEFREKLIVTIYPELNDCDGYLADRSMHLLSRNLGVPESLLWETFDRSGGRKSIAARGLANVIGGRSKASLEYQQRIWTGLHRLCQTCSEPGEDVMEAIVSECGNAALHERLYHQKVATLTGRIRDGVKFTDSKNTPFQSLAADGSKLALWNLLYDGFDVYGFIHDEILVNLPKECPDSDAERVIEIMESSMEEVLCGIPANCEWILSDRWTKPD